MSDVEIMNAEKQGLVTNSVLMRVGFGVFGNSKKANVGVNTEADQDRFRVLKTLLKSDELKAISKADQKLRQYIYKESIPFDMGSVLLSYKKIDKIIAHLDDYQFNERPALVSVFIEAYPGLINAAKAELKEEFNALDFPSPEVAAKEFTFEYRLLGFDVPGQLAGINKAVYQAEVEKAQAQIADVTHEIEQAQRAVLFSLVDNLAFKLLPKPDGKTRILNPGAVEKLQKFLSDFEMQDVTGDAQAKELVNQLRALTEGVSPETFKGNADLKAATATALMGIQDALEGMLDDKPERRYKDLEEEVPNA